MGNSVKGIDYGNWEPCYAWFPIKTIKEQWVWREHIYKRYVLCPGVDFGSIALYLIYYHSNTRLAGLCT